MSDPTERLHEIARDIDGLIASLDEISFDVLREARRDGRARPEIDRTVTQARRALEKASRLLSERESFDD